MDNQQKLSYLLWHEIDDLLFKRIIQLREHMNQFEFTQRLEEILWVKDQVRIMADLPEDRHRRTYGRMTAHTKV